MVAQRGTLEFGNLLVRLIGRKMLERVLARDPRILYDDRHTTLFTIIALLKSNPQPIIVPGSILIVCLPV